MEQTLVVLKPDAVQRGIMGEIITRFEKIGFKVIAMKMVWPSESHYREHYEGIGKLISRRGEDVYNINLAAMMKAPVVALVLEGIDAVECVRKMVGATDPKDSAPGTIRGDFTHVSLQYSIANGITLPNILHASADLEEAKQEIPLWFNSEELQSYEQPHQETVHGHVPKKK